MSERLDGQDGSMSVIAVVCHTVGSDIQDDQRQRRLERLLLVFIFVQPGYVLRSSLLHKRYAGATFYLE